MADALPKQGGHLAVPDAESGLAAVRKKLSFRSERVKELAVEEGWLFNAIGPSVQDLCPSEACPEAQVVSISDGQQGWVFQSLHVG